MSNPIRVLNVAEKPSAAKTISEILSANRFHSRQAHSVYNRVFEFEYAIRGQQCHMVFTSVTGHLMELDFTEAHRKWHSCDPVTLYEAPVHKFVPQDKENIKKTLQEEARKCQRLVLWLDCDLEGENIAFEVVEVCAAANRRLDVWRAKFSSMNESEIHRGAQNLERPNQNQADAVDLRQEIDLRIGASFTRFQTMLLRDKFVITLFGDDTNREDTKRILSYGPCQFPTLGFIVERYWEIQAHEPEEFWKINCSHRSEEGVSTFNWMRGHMFDYTCAVVIYEMCVQEPTATVTQVKERQTLKYPPFPLSTVELAKRASRYFRMSSDHTMKVAEELYQAGFISYPRTETDSFSERTDLHAIVQEQQEHPEWGSYAQRLLDPGAALWRNPGNGGHSDEAHPPIHPTKLLSAGESRWTQDHKRLYELVVRHFLACVSQPAVGAETTVEIDIAGEQFYVSGRAIIAKNYLDVYRFENWGDSAIPKYVHGQQFMPTTLTLDSGLTAPPHLLSEADLLSRMDKEKIGTDATMHDHIKKQLDRCYATKDANTRFSPTNLGEALVMGYDDMGYELWKPYLRAQMERDLKEVSAGRRIKPDVLRECLQQMKDCFKDARLNKVKLEEAMDIFFERSNRSGGNEHHAVGEIVRPCGVCNECNMVLKRKPDGKFMVGCMGFPQCRNVIWLPGSISEATVTAQVCNSCTPGPVFMIQFKFRQLEIPAGWSVNHLGCVGGCDETLGHLMEISRTGFRSSSSVPVSSARGQGPRASATNAQQTNTRQGACVHCRQTGHSSISCPSRTVQSQSAQPRRRNSQSGETSVNCSTCGAPSVLRTANTENNRGRKFYSCQQRECNFFVWEDGVNNSTGGESAPRSNRGRGTSNSRSNPAATRGGRGRGSRGGRQGANTANGMFLSATGEPISGQCYTCGDPSHFANNCPNRNR